jgi:DNA polymerase-3 subunit delta
MKSYSYQQLITQPASAIYHHCYLVLGKDGYLGDKTYQFLSQLIKKKLDSPETILIYGDELTTAELSDYLESYSVFAANRILIIRNADRLGEENKSRKNTDRQKKMLELITAYLQNPETSQVIIMIAEAVDGKMTGWKKIKEAAIIIECNPPRYAGEMVAWLIQVLGEKRISIEPRAKELFLSKVELDYCTADNELDKLFILIGQRKTITEKDVQTSMPSTRAGTQTDFYRVLGNRQTRELLLKVDEMLAGDLEPLILLSTLSKFFQTLWKIHALKNKHISAAEIAEKHLNEIFATQRNEYIAYTNKYPYREMTSIFQTLMDTDTRIKLSMAEPKILLTICLMKICYDR